MKKIITVFCHWLCRPHPVYWILCIPCTILNVICIQLNFYCNKRNTYHINKILIFTMVSSTITMPSLVGLGFHPPPGWPKTLSFFCLVVCLFVCSSRFWTSEIVRPISPRRRWSTETILMPLDRGRFVVVHLCSTFWDWCQLATSLNAEVQKRQKCVCLSVQRVAPTGRKSSKSVSE